MNTSAQQVASHKIKGKLDLDFSVIFGHLFFYALDIEQKLP
jgi:hypothetical protein